MKYKIDITGGENEGEIELEAAGLHFNDVRGMFVSALLDISDPVIIVAVWGYELAQIDMVTDEKGKRSIWLVTKHEVELGKIGYPFAVSVETVYGIKQEATK